MPILTFFHRECLSNILSKDFSSLVYDYSVKYGEFLFGTDLLKKLRNSQKSTSLSVNYD